VTTTPINPVPAPRPALQLPPTPQAAVLNAATRHLSAGAYLDPGFCQRTLSEVYHQKRRLVAPSYGFDLAAVLHHCLRARRINLIADGAALAIVLVAACVSAAGTLVALFVLAGLYQITNIVRFLQQAAADVRDQSPGMLGRLYGGLFRLFYRAVATWAVILLAYFLLALRISGSASGSGETTLDTDASIGAALLVALLVIGTYLAAAIWRQTNLSGLRPGVPQAPLPRNERIEELLRQQGGNTTVYSGYRPFVGSGEELETHGFALRLVRRGDGLAGLSHEALREFAQPPFTSADLLRHLGGTLGELVMPPLPEVAPERVLPNFSVEDRLFMAGTETSQLSPHLDPNYLAYVIRNPTGPVRHYLACRVVSWDGELVTTVYVHIAVQGRSLYVEISSWGLTPCADRYRQVDEVRNEGPLPFLRAAWNGLLDAPASLAQSPRRLVRAGVDAITATTGNLPPVGTPVTRGFDYGARWSLREDAAELPRAKFQLEDILKYKRIIERRVLASVLDFLDANEVDTSEYRQRLTAVLNSGVIISGNSNSSFGPVGAVNTGQPAGEQ
jgi:hypothetical protein